MNEFSSGVLIKYISYIILLMFMSVEKIQKI